MSNMYLDPNGKEIPFREWKRRIPAEYIIHEHTTPKSITRIMAADIVTDANLIPAARHKRYKLESTNIMTHDSMGEEYPEPKYVEDDFARKTFATKDLAFKAYIDFLCEWCGAIRSDIESTLAVPVKVTPVPAIDFKPRDMELTALSRKIEPAVVTTGPADPEEADYGEDDPDELSGRPAKVKKGSDAESKKTAPAAPKGSDAPVTMITDDIGSW